MALLTDRHRRASRLTGVALIVVLFSSIDSLSAAAGPTKVVRLTNIGGLPLSAGFSDAIRKFGPLGAGGGRAQFDDGDCTVRYPNLGVSLWYEGSPPRRGKVTAQTCRYFVGGAVSGRGWHLLNGLAVGDSTTKLRRLSRTSTTPDIRGQSGTILVRSLGTSRSPAAAAETGPLCTRWSRAAHRGLRHQNSRPLRVTRNTGPGESIPASTWSVLDSELAP